MVAKTVLLRVDVVGMPRPKGLGNIAVVLAALILIADQQGDRRARRAALEDPERISTSSGSRRCVTWREVPGLRRSSSAWMSAALIASPGGQPSTTQPIAGPCDSPNEVTANRVPMVLPDMARLAQTHQQVVRPHARMLATGLWRHAQHLINKRCAGG
jgi:hypothetical protein